MRYFEKDAPILPGKVIRRMVVVAIVMAVFTLGTYGVSLQVLGSKEQANTLAFELQQDKSCLWINLVVVILTTAQI